RDDFHSALCRKDIGADVCILSVCSMTMVLTALLRLLVTLFSCALIVLGEILLKQGMRRAGLLRLHPKQLWATFSQWPVWAGLLLLGTSAILWLVVVIPWQLGYAHPLFTLTYLAIVGLAWWFTGETLTMGKGFGTGMITVGLLITGGMPLDGRLFWDNADVSTQIVALLLALTAMLLWLRILSRWQLSYAYPLLSFNTAVMVPLSWVVLSTKPSLWAAAGAGLIVLGIVVVIRGGQA